MPNNKAARKFEASVLLPELAITLTANHTTIATLYERDVMVFVTFDFTPEIHASGSIATGDWQEGEPARVDLKKIELISGGDLGIEDDDTFKLRVKTDTDLMQILSRTQLQYVEDEVFKRAVAGDIE